MSSLICYACGAPLAEEPGGVFRCTNSNCPGKVFRKCGYCGENGQALFEDSVECFNSECRAHQTRLYVCPDCRYPALIKAGDESACIFRECTSNVDVVQDCAFCGFQSFLRRDGVDFCSKSRCAALFRPMRECDFCHSWMVDQATDTCQNMDCAHHDEQFVQCAACNKFTYTLDSDRCLNAECPSAQHDEPTVIMGGEEKQDDGLAECTECGQPDFLVAEGRCLNIRCKLYSEGNTIQAIGPGLVPPPPTTEDPVPAEEPPSTAGPPVEEPPPAVDPSEHDAPTVPPRQPMVEQTDPKPLPPVETTSPPSKSGFKPPPAGPPKTPDPTTTAGPPRTAATAGGDVQLGADEVLDIRKAYEVVKKGLFSVNGAESCPLLLVMGTAGAGKTAFLATLGKILRERDASYCFPYAGVEADPIDYQRLVDLLASGERPEGEDRTRMVRSLRESIGDLVHTYAEDVFDRYISKGIWCGFTEHDFGQFLVASVMRRRQPVANIVTLETSGENFKQVLRGINDLTDLSMSSSPIVSVMADMLRQASGIVILMDPSAPQENDATYQQFFNHLSRHLHHRVHLQLDSEITKRLEESGVQAGQASGRKEKLDQLQQGELKRDVEAARDELAALEELLRIFGSLAVNDHLRRFQNMLEALEKVIPGMKARLQSNIDAAEGDTGKITDAWKSVVAKARENMGPFTKELFTLMLPDTVHRQITNEELLARSICFARGVSPDTADDFDWERGASDSPEQFPNLRDIAMVFSKADMHPVVHPPEMYPELRLPRTKGALQQAARYITFLGGTVRYYNASVLGYSCYSNGVHSPGIEASLTPVNIIEPVFDMLAEQLR